MSIYTSRHVNWQATNTPEKLATIFTEEVVKRFWSKVAHFARSENYCWMWAGQMTPSGYGLFAVGGLELRAHRASYLIHKGVIDADLHVMHLCHNRACINPAHLKAGTVQENLLDRKLAVGVDHGFSRLTAKQILAIRNSREKLAVLAARYGISKPSISQIRTGKHYADLPGPRIRYGKVIA